MFPIVSIYVNFVTELTHLSLVWCFFNPPTPFCLIKMRNHVSLPNVLEEHANILFHHLSHLMGGRDSISSSPTCSCFPHFLLTWSFFRDSVSRGFLGLDLFFRVFKVCTILAECILKGKIGLFIHGGELKIDFYDRTCVIIGNRVPMFILPILF